jgi:DNA-binding response OmpR family regulator
LKTLMIVDDDRLTSSLLQTLFELEDFAVTCVAESAMVIASIEEQEPSIVLLDFHLGNTESTAIIRQIRQVPAIARTPILVFSGEDKAEETLAAGADRFLIKPLNPTKLVEIVKQMTC